MHKLYYSLIFLVFISCSNPKKEVDLIFHHGVIYTVDSTFSIQEAIAIKDGKIIEVGSNELITDSYNSKQTIDLEGKTMYPGFIDAHCHFYGYGKGLSEADLVGTHSYKDVLEKTMAFYKTRYLDGLPNDKAQIVKDNYWLIGRGWDQNDWDTKEFPTKEKLDSLFPDVPVFLKRIDGHAALVNQKVLNLVKFSSKTKILGGELILKNGDLTGVLVDNAVDSVEKLIPKASSSLIKRALLEAQKNCLAMGLTTVDDAGLEKNIIDVIDQLQKNNELKMRVYAMLTPNQENLTYYLKNGKYKTDKLNVCSFKFYADGALGSRGACLLEDYADKSKWKGFLLNDIAYFNTYAGKMDLEKFQMNTHCIGDSAVRAILMMYGTNPKMFGDIDGKAFNSITKERRWRIEHAQIVSKKDLEWIKALHVIPSIQPTHATSDMYWASERLGKERVKTAYAYKDLLNTAGMVALGTDFPVEDISPFKTFYAAVFRKDSKGFPEKGFQMENALSREETIRGMTIWAASSNFEEKEKGSLEKGKFADLIILDTDIMKCSEKNILSSKVISTYINGEKVFSKD